KLMFATGFGQPDAALLPADAADAPAGSIVELSPARSALMDEICHRLARHGGAAILIDYGYLEPCCGDTLQAMRRHGYADILDEPGTAVVTAHVDFSALAAIA